MSLQTMDLHFIVCDGCGKRGPIVEVDGSGPSPHFGEEAQEAVRVRGWICVSETDCCPECVRVGLGQKSMAARSPDIDGAGDRQATVTPNAGGSRPPEG